MKSEAITKDDDNDDDTAHVYDDDDDDDDEDDDDDDDNDIAHVQYSCNYLTTTTTSFLTHAVIAKYNIHVQMNNVHHVHCQSQN